MSITLPTLILDTVLTRLALLFLAAANSDPAAARQAAHQMLAAYHPETPDELALAAEIVGFSFHAMEALGHAAAPDISLNQKLRLRGSAVSLSRESHKSQRKLDQLQKARRAGLSVPPQPPAETSPQTEKALAVIEAARHPEKTQTWTQSYQQRQKARRIAENLRKNQLRKGSDTPVPPSPSAAVLTQPAQPSMLLPPPGSQPASMAVENNPSHP